MATVNKASLRTEFDALKARFESLCAAGKMSAESRALVDALLMLFELLMAVFMEKHTPKSSANSSLPASLKPQRRHRPLAPRRQGQGALVQRCGATPTPAPASTSGCSPSILARAAAKTSPTPPAPVTSGAPSSTSCSRRSCAMPTPKSSTARAVTPRPVRASPPRCADRCSTAPASRPTSCTCSSRRCSH